MLRTDHCYPPTVHAPLDAPTVFDFHFEAITMPAPLPPTIEPLAPSPRRTNNPPVPPEVLFTDDEAEALWARTQEARRRWGASSHAAQRPGWMATEERLDELMRQPRVWTPYRITPHTEPPSRVPWLACAIGAALFAVGYLIGKYLP